MTRLRFARVEAGSDRRHDLALGQRMIAVGACHPCSDRELADNRRLGQVAAAYDLAEVERRRVELTVAPTSAAGCDGVELAGQRALCPCAGIAGTCCGTGGLRWRRILLLGGLAFGGLPFGDALQECLPVAGVHADTNSASKCRWQTRPARRDTLSGAHRRRRQRRQRTV
jgi:hypothetical protein